MNLGKKDGGLAVYKALLSIDRVPRFVFGAVIAQFPYSMLAMAILVGVRDGWGSYTQAGIAGAIMAIAGAVLGPQVGKAIDRWGQYDVVKVVATIWLLSQGVLALVLTFHPPIWVVYLNCVLLGVNVPSNSILRSRWIVALRDRSEKMPSALSLTSVLEECMWVIGTPVSAALATLISPQAPIAFASIAVVVGIYVMLLPDRTHEPPVGVNVEANIENATLVEGSQSSAGDAKASSRKSKPRLFSPAYISLLIVFVFYGAFQSTTGIAVVAFADELNKQEYAGVVTGCFSCAAMLSAIAYGTRNWTSPLWLRFYVGLIALAIGCSALVFVTALPTAAMVLFVSGLFQAPTVININQILIKIIPKLRFTEGMALQGSMWVIGLSTSNLVGGAMIDRFGSAGGFYTIVGFAVIALVVGTLSLVAVRRELEK